MTDKEQELMPECWDVSIVKTVQRVLNDEGYVNLAPQLDEVISVLKSRERYNTRPALSKPNEVDVDHIRDATKKVGVEDLRYIPNKEKFNADQASGFYYCLDHLNANGYLGGGWQSIESAPKDGTEILVPYDDWSGYVPIRWGVYQSDGYTEGWFQYNFEDELSFTPTHWMPLPNPPIKAAQTEKE